MAHAAGIQLLEKPNDFYLRVALRAMMMKAARIRAGVTYGF